MPIKAAAFALALVLSAFFVQDVSAQPAAQSRTPLQLAEAVERRAGTTDFRALEAFGREAIRRNDREGLQRLYHVAWIFLNQGEFDTARIWNDRLMEGARHQGSHRYIQIARLNALALRYDEGETPPDCGRWP